MATHQSSAVELDFLGLHKEFPPPPPPMERRRSFRGIQNAISKIDPQIVKSVIASTYRSRSDTANGIAPLTIFHNGAVMVFDVSKDQAESIFKMARAVSAKNVEAEKVVVALSSSEASLSVEGDELQEGLPRERRKSLERFFQKRKERLSATPYDSPKGKFHAVSGTGPHPGRGQWVHQLHQRI